MLKTPLQRFGQQHVLLFLCPARTTHGKCLDLVQPKGAPVAVVGTVDADIVRESAAPEYVEAH